MADSVPTRLSLLVQLRDRQNDQAWKTFVELYTPLVYGYCRHCRLQPHDAADVTQEVFARVVHAIAKFDYEPRRGRFRDWLGTITRNEIARLAGKRKSERATCYSATEWTQPEPSESDTGWSEVVQAHVMQVALQRSQQHFEPVTWRAFELAWLQNQRTATVAEQLDMSTDKIYVAKSRVLKRLREEVLALIDELSE